MGTADGASTSATCLLKGRARPDGFARGNATAIVGTGTTHSHLLVLWGARAFACVDVLLVCPKISVATTTVRTTKCSGSAGRTALHLGRRVRFPYRFCRTHSPYHSGRTTKCSK